MRNAFLYSLPIAIVAVAGCGSGHKEQVTRSDLERDLTLATGPQETAVVSAIELGRLPSQAGRNTSVQKVAVRQRAAHKSVAGPRAGATRAPATKPVIADVPAPRPSAEPAPAAIPTDSHELPPGKTVTVIPVSSGPSTAGGARGPDEIPVGMEGTGGSGMGGGGSGMGGGGSGMGGSGMGGGHCPGRGAPGIGIATRPRGLLY
jgi:hypothetical protein